MSDDRPVCLLTGAGGRLGTEFCRRFAHRYRIIAAYRRDPPAVPTQAQQFVDPLAPGRDCPENQTPVWAIRCDLLADGGPEALVRAARARFGRIDALVHAGMASRWALVADPELAAAADAQLAMAVTVPLRLTAELLRQGWDAPATRAEPAPSVVLVSSTAGAKLYEGQGQSVYGAAKAGMNQLARHLASELAPLAIRVNVVAPNSFPGRIPTSWVADRIAALIEGEGSGSILTLDQPSGAEV